MDRIFKDCPESPHGIADIHMGNTYQVKLLWKGSDHLPSVWLANDVQWHSLKQLHSLSGLYGPSKGFRSCPQAVSLPPSSKRVCSSLKPHVQTCDVLEAYLKDRFSFQERTKKHYQISCNLVNIAGKCRPAINVAKACSHGVVNEQ